MDIWIQYAILIAVGFVVGFINTVAGGASLLSLPMFIFMGLPPAVANGTNRVAILVQTAVGAAGFKSKGVGNFPFNLYLGLSAMVGAVIGAQISLDIKGETFNKVLVVIMFAVVALMVFKPKAKTQDVVERLTGKHLWLSIVAFFFIGIYGGFINAGIEIARNAKQKWIPEARSKLMQNSPRTVSAVVNLFFLDNSLLISIFFNLL